MGEMCSGATKLSLKFRAMLRGNEVDYLFHGWKGRDTNVGEVPGEGFWLSC